MRSRPGERRVPFDAFKDDALDQAIELLSPETQAGVQAAIDRLRQEDVSLFPYERAEHTYEAGPYTLTFRWENAEVIRITGLTWRAE